MDPVEFLPPTSFPSHEEKPDWLTIVERQVKALKIGSVQITVREGRVTSVETSVRVRFEKPAEPSSRRLDLRVDEAQPGQSYKL